jgi:hypothetical protein
MVAASRGMSTSFGLAALGRCTLTRRSSAAFRRLANDAEVPDGVGSAVPVLVPAVKIHHLENG